MTDKTLREEFNDLRDAVNTFLGAQKTWNEKHDERSREVLEGLEKRTDKLFGLHETMLQNFSELTCKEQALQISSNKEVTDEKIKSVEKRIKLITYIGVSFSVVLVGGFLKLIFVFI